MKKLLLLPLGAAFGLLSLGLPGCGNKTAATAENTASPAVQAQALGDTIMAHHELAMNQTERLYPIKAQLLAAKVPAKAPIIGKMLAADRAMMTWMNAYHAPDSTAPAPQRLAYLQDQHKQLTAIEQQLTVTLDSAQALLSRVSKPVVAPTPAAPQPK